MRMRGRGVLLAVLMGVGGMAVGQVGGGARVDRGARGETGRRGEFVGFDLNDYPGDGALAGLRERFAFVGYWLTTPPGETGNTWVGKRAVVRAAGFGFLVLANGRLDAEILKSAEGGMSAEALGRRDAGMAVAAALREGFPAATIVFLDQEEGGRLLGEQAAYVLAWTEAVAGTGFRAGVYASGQPVPDGKGPGGRPQTITTVEDIRSRVKAGGLHEVTLWVAQDACPPSNGCTLRPPAMEASGTVGAAVWQYAQSPRRPEMTRACGATYGRDGNCSVAGLPGVGVDLNVATSGDPSGGR